MALSYQLISKDSQLTHEDGLLKNCSYDLFTLPRPNPQHTGCPMLSHYLLIPALLALSPFCLKAADVVAPTSAATAVTKEQVAPAVTPDAMDEEECSENAPRDDAAALPKTPVAKKTTADTSSDCSDDETCKTKPAVVKK